MQVLRNREFFGSCIGRVGSGSETSACSHKALGISHWVSLVLATVYAYDLE